MMQQNSFPPIVVLSETTAGTVECMSVDGEPLPLLNHTKGLACIFVPVLLVEQSLAYKDYALYLLKNEMDVTNKINNLLQQEEHAILLVGCSNDRNMYFIEDRMLISSKAMPISCKYFPMIKRLIINDEGKAIGGEKQDDVATIIRFLRLASKRGNEAGTAGVRVGNHVFSKNFAPCNAVVARRKKDNQFIIYHAYGLGLERVAGGGLAFLEAMDYGEGSNFTAVMQNPKNTQNYLKAPMIVAQLATEYKDPNVHRINFPEGYSAIACVNSNTIIVSLEMEFFRNKMEKYNLANQFNLADLEPVRILDLDAECIPLRETAIDLVKQYHTERENQHLKQAYGQLIGKLGIFKFDDEAAKLMEDHPKSNCCSLM